MNQKDLIVTVEMACSVDGKIADEKGEEGFLLERGWEIMLELLQEQDVLIWGRKTFESVCTWGEEYVQELKKIPIILFVLTLTNVWYNAKKRTGQNYLYLVVPRPITNFCKQA